MQAALAVRRKPLQALLLFAAVTLLAGCAESGMSWNEERCVKSGLQRGTPAFQQCIARENAYIEENRRINDEIRRSYR